MEGEVRWDFRWDVRFNDYGSRTLNINNNGHVEAPFELELFGYCEKPKVIVSQNGETVATVTFPITLQLDEKTSKLDIHNTNFFKLPVGDCMVDFTSDTGAANKTVLTVYKFFRTV